MERTPNQDALSSFAGAQVNECEQNMRSNQPTNPVERLRAELRSKNKALKRWHKKVVISKVKRQINDELKSGTQNPSYITQAFSVISSEHSDLSQELNEKILDLYTEFKMEDK
ncbi:unnamed protein product [Blepharisma stoltei]|uniref:Uncharacterized protein n=1 Tax=Blepharisma stoltei TaxID=1481888 RepID=A0AAU9I7T1_9CILI|nr:unnamed protein product [Blepharisma stoltei]